MLQLQFLAGDAAIEQQTLTDLSSFFLIHARTTGVARYITLTLPILSMGMVEHVYDPCCTRVEWKYLLAPPKKKVKISLKN